jgi:ADP-ribosyltransferase exoenzyme
VRGQPGRRRPTGSACNSGLIGREDQEGGGNTIDATPITRLARTLDATEQLAARIYTRRAGQVQRAVVAAMPAWEERAVVRHLDAAIGQSFIGHEAVLWRGISVNGRGARALRDGAALTSPRFTSVSASELVAKTRAERRAHDELWHRPALLRITAPAGSSALDVAPYSSWRFESELLLPRDSSLRVVGTPHTKGGLLRVDAQLVAQDAPSTKAPEPAAWRPALRGGGDGMDPDEYRRALDAAFIGFDA